MPEGVTKMVKNEGIGKPFRTVDFHDNIDQPLQNDSILLPLHENSYKRGSVLNFPGKLDKNTPADHDKI